MRRKKKLFYVLHISNKITGMLVRVLTYKDYNVALKQLNFYNDTVNLKATMDTIWG